MQEKIEKSKKSSDLREKRNEDILKRMREGDPLTSFDGAASWFPPRPVIQKNSEDMARVYSSEGSAASQLEPKVKEAKKRQHFFRVVKS